MKRLSLISLTVFSALAWVACDSGDSSTDDKSNGGGKADKLDGCEADADCAGGEFCEFQGGQCGGSGTCSPSAGIACTAQFDPVCGCDGNTYSNACMAGAAGQSIEHDGPCGSDSAGGTACTDSSECAAEEYCELDSCGGSGSCVERPQVCLALYDPVCGCDGETYSNGCVASSYGQTVAAGGECPEGGDTGDDGATELSCDELEEQFNAENQAVRGCTEDAECGQPIPGTSCGCTRDLVGRADANFDRWTDLIAQARAQDCSWAWLYGGISTCDCPPADGFICGEAGFCQWNYQ